MILGSIHCTQPRNRRLADYEFAAAANVCICEYVFVIVVVYVYTWIACLTRLFNIQPSVRQAIDRAGKRANTTPYTHMGAHTISKRATTHINATRERERERDRYREREKRKKQFSFERCWPLTVGWSGWLWCAMRVCRSTQAIYTRMSYACLCAVYKTNQPDNCYLLSFNIYYLSNWCVLGWKSCCWQQCLDRFGNVERVVMCNTPGMWIGGC